MTRVPPTDPAVPGSSATPGNSSPPAEDFEWTATRFLFGELAPAEQARFEEQLSTDQSARDRFLNIVLVIQTAGALAPEPASVHPISTHKTSSSSQAAIASPRSMVRARVFPLGLLASLLAAFVVGASLFWMNQSLQPDTNLATVGSGSGPETEHDHAAPPVDTAQMIRDWNSLAADSESETESWLAEPLADPLDELDNAFQPPEWLLAVAELDAAQPAANSVFPANSDSSEQN